MLVWSFINSNTTLVKVKSPAAAVIPAVALHSNTTLVKVKFQGGI